MKAPFSAYLTVIAPALKELIALLREDFAYVSVLATDSPGFTLQVSQHTKSVTHATMTTERGIVVRVMQNGRYSEYAWNEFDPSDIRVCAEMIREELMKQIRMMELMNIDTYETGALQDEPLTLFVEKETDVLPENADTAMLLDLLQEISDRGVSLAGHAVECNLRVQSTHISKLFLTENRDLRQSYVYSEGMVSVVVVRDGETRQAYEGVSGCAGPEIFEELARKVETAAETAEKMLDAEKIVPGEYDIITTPEVTGLIAHEAFGHGVEMDMFVKNRALGREYIGSRVGSDLVSMHEGAACAESVTAYAFDDEGILAGDVTEIDHGILVTGICDALSAVRLGTKPTGNGKRQNYAHKAYTRMTNTVFDSGESTLEEMIASVSYGYLLDGMQSGMEDPKHWGIQCIVSRGYEIKDGKLTGKMVSPVVMTGYVPSLLGSVTMASADRVIAGNGGCGKGSKEWVKVADGGPYLKARATLG